MSDTPLATVAAPEANGTAPAPEAPALDNTWTTLTKEVLYTTGNDVSRQQADMARDMMRTRVHHLTDVQVAHHLSTRALCSKLINALKDRDLVSRKAPDVDDPALSDF